MSNIKFNLIFQIIINISKIRLNSVMELKKKLGKRIKEIRLSRNIPQEYVAEVLGINPSNYSRIETGYSYPRSENLEKICEVLEVSPKELFDFEHLEDIESIRSELVSIINSNDELLRLAYKFVKNLIY